MKLPFLKESKLPRVAPEPRAEKAYGLSPDEKLEDYCMGELMDACAAKDVSRFRGALEALVLNLFETEEPQNA